MRRAAQPAAPPAQPPEARCGGGAALSRSAVVEAAEPSKPTSRQVGKYTFPLDAEGAVMLDEHRVRPNHVTPKASGDPQQDGVCVRVCSSNGIGQPIPGNKAWNLYCLET